MRVNATTRPTRLSPLFWTMQCSISKSTVHLVQQRAFMSPQRLSQPPPGTPSRRGSPVERRTVATTAAPVHLHPPCSDALLLFQQRSLKPTSSTGTVLLARQVAHTELSPQSSLSLVSKSPLYSTRPMKFLALRVLALCGLAALVAQPAAAQPSVCSVECVGPYNACSWAAIGGEGTEAKCVSQRDQCVKACVKKNGGDKPYVFTPEASTKKKATTKA